MAFTLPSAIFDTYREMADELINNVNVGVTITLYYPEQISAVVDTSHSINLAGGPSTNYNNDGLPDNYMVEGGTSYMKSDVTDTMRVRLYLDPKDWKRLGVETNIPEVKAFMIGYMSDLSKLDRANTLTFSPGDKVYRYSLLSQPEPWGFTKNRYFIAKLKAA